MTNHFHQPAHALFAAGTERRYDPVIAEARCKRFIRNLELARINSQAREGSRRSQTAKCAFKCLLSAKCLDRYIRAAPSQTFYFRHHVHVAVIERNIDRKSTRLNSSH